MPGRERPRAAPGRGRKAATRKGAEARAATGRHVSRGSHPRPADPARTAAVLAGLDRLYPDARCELDFGSPLQLLIATILSAQCTDQRVNMVTPALFARYPDAAAFAAAPLAELEEMVRSTGFYRNKAKA
ncbi:MAG: hypothetical protein ABIR22_04265, partial [Candidatus Eisenbacteria bacterium]